jgi:hypothetical protein
MDNVEASK